MSMDSLYRHSLKAVASVIESSRKNSDYEESCYMDLPRGVSHDLLFYLSPRKLFLSSDLLTKHNINTERVWHIHFKKRWSYKHQSAPKIFKHVNTVEKQIAMSKYIEKHFHDVFRASTFPFSSQEAQLSKGLLYMNTSVQEHVIRKPKTVISANEREDLIDKLTLISYVSNLSILANQSKMLFKSEYIDHLRKNVTRLDLHVLKKSNIDDATNLVLELLHNGVLKELNLFHPRLAMRTFERLIHACAGHIKPTVAALPEPKQEAVLEIGNWNAKTNDKPISSTEPTGPSGGTTDNWNSIDAATNTFPIEMFMDLFKTKHEAEAIIKDYQEAIDDDEWLDSEEEITTDESSGDELFDNALEGLDDEHPEHDFDMQGLSWYKSKEIYSCVNPWEIERDEDDIREFKCTCHEEMDESKCNKGLKAFSIIGIERVESDFYNDAPRLPDVLVDAFPNWRNLECLALAGCEIKDLFLPSEIACLTSKSQLKEITVENMKFTDGSILEFIDEIINQEGREKPVERLRLMNIHRDIFATKEEVEALPKVINGFVEFELRGGNLFEKGMKYITTMVSRDQSLRHLSLCGLNAQKKSMVKILQASRATKLLESLDLSESYFDEDVEKELCKTIKDLANLKSLSVKSTLVSKEFLISDEFIDVLTEHKNLTDIDLSDNRFGTAIPTFLCKILTEKLSRLESINVAYTMCTGDMLLSAAKEILGPNHCGTEYICYKLKKIDVSGNKLGKMSKDVVMKLGLIAQDVECKCEDFTVPFAEHISQM